MKSINTIFRLSYDALNEGIDDNWDSDDAMPEEHVLSLPVGKFVMDTFAIDPEVLSWLVFFVARRALPCWETPNDHGIARKRIVDLGRFLLFGVEPDWSQLEMAVTHPYGDNRFSETQSAADSAAEAARYIHKKDPMQAIYSISSADLAYDHIRTQDLFRVWFVQVAVPVAFEKREMTPEEMELLRCSPRLDRLERSLCGPFNTTSPVIITPP